MGQRYQLPDGRVVEALPQGGYQVVSTGAMTGGNPKLPGEIAGQALSNQRTMQEIRQAQATATATTRKATAEASKAEIDAQTAQEAYDAAHPKGTGATIIGPDSLKSLSIPDQELVKALAEGRLAFPAGFALKAPWWQQKLEQVAQYDPTFDATNYNNRAKARASLINGKVGTSANALNTAIGHVGLLNDQISGTASHSFIPANKIENAWDQYVLGQSGITNYKDTAGKLASEETSVYRNGGGAEADVERYLKSFDPNAADKQKRDVVRNTLDLFASKQAANLYQFNLSSGGKPSVDLLDPAARAVLDKFPDIRDKYFTQPSAPLSREAAALIQANGGQPPPSAPGAPQSRGFTPPPTGPASGMTFSGDGQSEKPDPQSQAFWESAARQGTPYGAALSQWQKQLPTGQSVVTPPDPRAYGKVVDYIRRNPNAEYHPFQGILRTPTSASGAADTAAIGNPAGSFGVHYYDALLGHIPTRLAGDEGAYFNAVSREQDPKSSAWGDLLGTVGGMAGTTKAVKGVAPLLGKYGQIIGGTAPRAALTGDTIYGGVSGADQNPDHPVAGGALGMAATAGGNAAGRYIFGPAVAAALDTAPVQRAVTALRFGKQFTPPSPLDLGPKVVLGQSGNAINNITTNLEDASRLNLPYALADADPKLRLLAGSATRKSPNVRAMAENMIIPRQLGQGERAIGQINTSLAPVGDVPTMQASTLKSAQSQSAPLYNTAKTQPVPDLTKNPALAEVLDRPAAQSAVRNGYNTALNNGEDVGSLTYATDPNGNTVQYGNPSWNVIHYARQELDKSGETAVRRALDQQIAGLNPGFKAADAKYAGIMKGSDALQAGADATGIRVTPEATQGSLAGFPNNGSQFQQGYASNMADVIGRQRMSSNPYDLVNGSMFQKQKLGLVFPQGAGDFSRAHALEGDMSKTAYETLGGSPTAARAQSDQLFNNPAADAAIDLGLHVTTGAPPTRLLMRAFQKAADTYRMGSGTAKADALGPILLNPDPNASLAAIKQWLAATAARKDYLSRVGAASGQAGAGLLGAPILLGASQN